MPHLPSERGHAGCPNFCMDDEFRAIVNCVKQFPDCIEPMMSFLTNYVYNFWFIQIGPTTIWNRFTQLYWNKWDAILIFENLFVSFFNKSSFGLNVCNPHMVYMFVLYYVCDSILCFMFGVIYVLILFVYNYMCFMFIRWFVYIQQCLKDQVSWH